MRKLITALPDGGVNALSGLQGAQTVGRISAAPSGRKLLLLTLVLFFITFATHAQVVDTWTFANPQQQEQALSIASQLRCPQCQNQNLLESNAPVAVSMRHQVYSFVRYNPPLNEQTLLLWALPCLLLLLVGVVVWRVRRRQHTEEGE